MFQQMTKSSARGGFKFFNNIRKGKLNGSNIDTEMN